MKIVHVVRQFYPSVGGLEEYVQSLAAEQSAAGHDVIVITLNTDFQTNKMLLPFEEYQGLVIKRVPWCFSTRYPICRMDIKELSASDIVHVHAVDYLVDYLSWMKRVGRLKAKLILTTHGGFFHTSKSQRLKKVFFKTATRFSLAKVDAVLCCSSNDFLMFKGISKNSRLINNGVRLRKFGPAEQAIKTNDIVYLGRFSSNKRLTWLIEAYAQIKNPAGLLKIIGRSKTGNVDELVTLIEKLGCESRVQLILDVGESEILGHLLKARFTVSASEYEGFGLSVVELMSYGLVPFLSIKTPSFNEFINDSGAGVSFDYCFDDFNASYEILISSWSTTLALKAAMYAEQFSWRAVSEEIFNVYRSTLEHRIGSN